MAKFDDAQVDVKGKAFGEVHSPAGSTPAHGADAPFVHPLQAGTDVTGAARAGFSKNIQFPAAGTNLRIANPA